MNREEPTVVAICATADETMATVNQLTQEGYSREDIMVYAHKGTTDSFESKEDVRVEKDGQSMWEKVKDTFRSDDQAFPDYLEPYMDDIRAGEYAVVVEGYRGRAAAAPEPEPREETPSAYAPHIDRKEADDDTIRLKEEQLRIDKHEVQTGDVDVSKNIVKEVRTIQVPVEREELVVEKHSFQDGDGESETIRIPLKEEEVEVTKTPVVKEEVSVRKEVTEDVEQISEEVMKERLDVDTQGGARVKERNPDDEPPSRR